MNCLLLDTATEACSVALQIQGQALTRFEICPQQHSQRILPMVDEVLKEGRAVLNQLDFLGFGQGPGSFTGVRIATGILQGLALGSELPVVGVSTLAAMAQQAIVTQDAQEVYCAIDARMGEVYFAHYIAQDGLAILQGAEQVLPPESAIELMTTNNPVVGVGTGWAAYPHMQPQHNFSMATAILYPNAEFMLPLAHALFAQGKVSNAEHVQPVYLRDTVTWKKLPGRE
ncbi:tRNA (adenosine(37)-N6)-threonylcarbamoyltransferase complex dimerization subunit type 1 TsaB [Paraglaciecola sp.]|uniref:tRNA (adenosine(37)-N6)-threonylcarbamoyltransferase complex dimerization subunit type 1 TsaB n=1 Tax=Paraglaciecola sp. TaxID=1920173 RepID=UPI00273DD052|nr:tRNA (adenosine(37)-N6)-threonylcarbamoyltransferase complex dimerization subunit type 1 TsaB [Paraglaciecola sp.]MDP5028908.1 tRNA (adenosine(37)-N6)-threonylcarbamoyltransferase complex dimerization subunit type 1 TsaB [Paraglaciecola sp.]